MNKLKIIIFCQSQFGYHIDTYMYAKYLSKDFYVTYVCWDYGFIKLLSEETDVSYISRSGNIFVRNLRYLYMCFIFLKKNHYDFVFIKYFLGCSVLRILFPFYLFVFDVRTASVSSKYLSRKIFDYFIWIESKLFHNITVVSKSLAEKLKLSKNARVIPLGSEVISKKVKKFDTIDLLYVGTLSGRSIEKTIIGLSKFCSHYAGRKAVSYTIIGSGYNNEEKVLSCLVDDLDLSEVVKIVGKVPFDNLKPYFDDCNVGVSFVPMLEYYDSQPATKNFDYLLSGMPVIATATTENKKVINSSNGIIIEDTPESFCNGLIRFVNSSDKYNSKIIMDSSKIYSWSAIVEKLYAWLLSIK